MNTRDQFGNYLLLKKLSEDALGESFRAGRIGKQGLERVVLLRVFNGQGLDGDRLGQRMQGRAAIQQALKSPNLGQGVDLGQVRGVPYVAYDYVSGRSLSQLVEQAGRKHSPIPLDHALLMAERIALGLAVAYETRLGDERLLHGFVVPQLVLVSNEGELRLLGFEASTGLRESAGHPLIKEAVGRYLAPELAAGQAPTKADDVYSLGAILFELLTAQKVPGFVPGGLGGAVDQAVIASDGGNLHPDLANLLKRSLVPREQRIADAVLWHKTLAKLMFDGQYNPTTFNLAFFMHNLFREEIERETQELESEKTTQIPVQQVAAAAAAPRAAAAAPSPVRDAPGPVREDTSVLRDKYGIGETAKGGNRNLILAAAGGGVAVLALVGYLVFGRGGAAPAPAPAASVPVPVETEEAPAQPAGPTPEEIQAQIERVVQEKLKSSSAVYEQQMKDLQKQLEDARKAQEARAAATAAPPRPLPAADPLETEAVAARPVATPAPLPVATATPTPEPTQVAAAVPTAAPTPAPTPATSAATSGVRPGDLVEAGPGVVAPRLSKQPQLRYPPLAHRMKKEATVVVRVLVDENGRVIDAQGTGAKAGFGLDEAALDYARSCTYTPATKGGVKVRMWTNLQVAFTLGKD